MYFSRLCSHKASLTDDRRLGEESNERVSPHVSWKRPRVGGRERWIIVIISVAALRSLSLSLSLSLSRTRPVRADLRGVSRKIRPLWVTRRRRTKERCRQSSTGETESCRWNGASVRKLPRSSSLRGTTLLNRARGSGVGGRGVRRTARPWGGGWRPYPSRLFVYEGWVSLAIARALALSVSTNILTVPTAMCKCTCCESLRIKASAKCP